MIMEREKENRNFKIDWVLMNLRLCGSPVDKERAVKIARGEYVLDATLEEHLLVVGLLALLGRMETLLGMGEELSAGTLNRFYDALTQGEPPLYRKRTPVLFHLSYNPVLPQEIEPELSKLFRNLRREEKDPVLRAVKVHNELVRIYPFDRHSEVIARAAMEYELRYSGLSFYPLMLSETEYNQALASYLKSGREEALAKDLAASRLMEESRGTRGLQDKK